jgi:hypothetical protein
MLSGCILRHHLCLRLEYISAASEVWRMKVPNRATRPGPSSRSLALEVLTISRATMLTLDDVDFGCAASKDLS